MKINIEKYLRYPIQIFNNKYVLRVTIYSCLLLYLTLSAANIVYNFSPDLFEEFKFTYSILKDSIYQVLLISSLGYFISKYKFCYWSLLSFYGVIYIKLIWFIDRYIYQFNNYFNIIDSVITITTLTMILYYFYKNHKIISN